MMAQTISVIQPEIVLSALVILVGILITWRRRETPGHSEIECQTCEELDKTVYKRLREENTELNRLARDADGAIVEWKCQCDTLEKQILDLMEQKESLHAQLHEVIEELRRMRTGIPDHIIFAQKGRVYHTHSECQGLTNADPNHLTSLRFCSFCANRSMFGPPTQHA